ncbi:hypothetical protein D3H35_05855 [Cohnella faecalis]|uniref:Uncharacterized protein n=1 Tax=Cohnella faecalis TaxID=2315694 RepID=A0A398CXL6_9BACL|nr:hypothetical protein D3H35_05855 [Cohnella faecalis]
MRSFHLFDGLLHRLVAILRVLGRLLSDGCHRSRPISDRPDAVANLNRDFGASLHSFRWESAPAASSRIESAIWSAPDAACSN